MLRKFVPLKNISTAPVVIYDKRLSGGSLTIAPGAVYDLANDIYMDHRRRNFGKLAEVATLPAELQSAAPTKCCWFDLHPDTEPCDEDAVGVSLLCAKHTEQFASLLAIDQAVAEAQPETSEAPKKRRPSKKEDSDAEN